MKKVKILKSLINEISLDEFIDQLLTSKKLKVAVCNANSLVRSYKNKKLLEIMNNFDISLPDGFPVAKASSLLYKNKQKRVDGYKIFNETIKQGLKQNTSHYFFGNSEEVVDKLMKKFIKLYPNINIVGHSCPPILDVDELMEDKYINDIVEKNPDIIWFSFGFPKQEILIDKISTRNLTSANLVGVGFVFEWTAGTKYKAPEFIANIGLEWVLRLLQEPRRLFKRYFVDNFLFIIYFIKQLTLEKR